jgi:hypothetical protein
MRNRFWVGLGLSTCLTTPAAAESWYQIASTDDSIEFADADSLRNSHGITGLTIFRGLDSAVNPYVKVGVELNCGGNQFRLTSVQNFGPSKEYLSADPTESAWSAITANTIGEAVKQFACDGLLRSTPVSDPFAAAEEYFYYYYAF